MTPEQPARQEIDAMLRASGWLIQKYKALNLSLGLGIAIREVPLKTGPCDYLLLVDRKPVGVIEAKKKGTTLSPPLPTNRHVTLFWLKDEALEESSQSARIRNHRAGNHRRFGSGFETVCGDYGGFEKMNACKSKPPPSWTPCFAPPNLHLACIQPRLLVPAAHFVPPNYESRSQIDSFKRRL